MSIQEFYSMMSVLWDWLALTELTSLHNNAKYLARREGKHLIQFLIALRDDFEGLWGNILHRHPHPFINAVVSELLAKKTSLNTQARKGPSLASSPSVLVVLSKPFLSIQTKPPAKVSFDECNFKAGRTLEGLMP